MKSGLWSNLYMEKNKGNAKTAPYKGRGVKRNAMNEKKKKRQVEL